MIRFRCTCGRQLQARGEDIGETARCPMCAALLVVPTEQEAMREAVTRTPVSAGAVPARGRGWREMDDAEARRRDSRRLDRDAERRPDEPRDSSRRANWALLLGVLSPFLCALGPVAALAAVVLGMKARREVARSGGQLGGGSAAVAGIVMGLIGLLVSSSATVVVWPRVQSVRERAPRAQGAKHLARLAAGMRAYEAKFEHLPAAASYSPNNLPLLSWRVAILPFIGEEALYEQFKLDEPWDSAHNKKLLPRMPSVYQLPGAETADGSTYIQVVTGPRTPFESPWALRPRRRQTRLIDITDGHATTVLIATAEQAVPWTSPQDMTFDGVALPRFNRRFREGHNVAMADGAVRWFRHAEPERAVRALLTHRGGEIVMPPDE